MKQSSRENASNETISSRLKWARKELGLKTQEDLAGVVGVKRATISTAEAGIRFPSEAFLYKLEERTGISRVWLLTGEGEWRAGPPVVSEAEPRYGDPGAETLTKELAELLAAWAALGPGRRQQALDFIRFLAAMEGADK